MLRKTFGTSQIPNPNPFQHKLNTNRSTVNPKKSTLTWKSSNTAQEKRIPIMSICRSRKYKEKVQVVLKPGVGRAMYQPIPLNLTPVVSSIPFFIYFLISKQSIPFTTQYIDEYLATQVHARVSWKHLLDNLLPYMFVIIWIAKQLICEGSKLFNKSTIKITL